VLREGAGGTDGDATQRVIDELQFMRNLSALEEHDARLRIRRALQRQTFGSKWQAVRARPKRGTEITETHQDHMRLTELLRASNATSLHDLEDVGVSGVTQLSFIEVDGKYYQPVPVTLLDSLELLLFRGTRALAQQGMQQDQDGSSTAIPGSGAKFRSEDSTLNYLSVNHHADLEEHIGHPKPNLEEQMSFEHLHHSDSAVSMPAYCTALKQPLTYPGPDPNPKPKPFCRNHSRRLITTFGPRRCSSGTMLSTMRRWRLKGRAY
jgi:hypothetical protein